MNPGISSDLKGRNLNKCKHLNMKHEQMDSTLRIGIFGYYTQLFASILGLFRQYMLEILLLKGLKANLLKRVQ